MAFNKAKVLEDIQRYIQKGQIDKAIEEYERILRIDPRDYKLRQKLGDLYLRKGKNAEAVNQYMMVAEYYIRDGFILKAIALYNQILRTDPTKLAIYEKLAELYKKQGLIGDAVSKLRSLAEIYEKQKNLADAIQTWEKIINMDPENVIYRGKLVEFYLKQGLASRAAEKLQQAVDYFKSKGRYDDVERLLTHFPGVLEEDKTVVVKLANSLFKAGKYKEAIEKIEQYIKINPKDAEAYFIKGSCYLNINQINIAKYAFEMALKLAPESTDARKGLLKIYAKERNWSQVIIILEELFKIYTKNKNLEEFKAVLDNYYPYLVEEKRLLKIYIELFRMTGERKGLLEKLKKLANVYKQEGEKEELGRIYKEILTIDNDDEEALSFFRTIERPAPPAEPTVTIDKEAFRKPSQVESIAAIEEIEISEEAETSLEKELAEIDNLLQFGLLPRAKAKLEEVSVRFPDTAAVKEKWLNYFDITKDKEAYLIVLKELIKIYKKEENTEKLVFYERLLEKCWMEHSFRERHIDEKPLIKAAEEEVIVPEEIEEEAEITIPNIEDLLIEADFYLKNDMADEAVRIYQKVLELDPDNVRAKEKLTLLQKSKEEPQSIPVAEKEKKEEFYDLSGEILKELEKEDFFDTTFKSEAEKISFENLLKEFKQKISQEIEEGDIETHYNLGIAYKEMGLYDDAIQEFILTSRFPQKTYDSYIMVATCLVEKNELKKAAEFYKRALKMPNLDNQKIAGVYLELGSVYEKLGEIDKAVICYNKAVLTDSSLKIAKEKVNNILLEKPELAKELDKQDVDF